MRLGRSPGTAPDARVRHARQRGVTLVEMLIVVTIISLMIGIAYPSVSAGLETLRLTGQCEEAATIFNSALNRAERSQQAIEIDISKRDNAIRLASALTGFERRLYFRDGVTIEAILPALPYDDQLPRRFLVYPGGTAPRAGVVLVNSRGDRRIVSVDPITGVSRVERVERP